MLKTIDMAQCFEVHIGLPASKWLMDCIFINTHAYTTPKAGDDGNTVCKDLPSIQNLQDFNIFPEVKTKITHHRVSPVKERNTNKSSTCSYEA